MFSTSQHSNTLSYQSTWFLDTHGSSCNGLEPPHTNDSLQMGWALEDHLNGSGLSRVEINYHMHSSMRTLIIYNKISTVIVDKHKIMGFVNKI